MSIFGESFLKQLMQVKISIFGESFQRTKCGRVFISCPYEAFKLLEDYKKVSSLTERNEIVEGFKCLYRTYKRTSFSDGEHDKAYLIRILDEAFLKSFTFSDEILNDQSFLTRAREVHFTIRKST
jgi:hypothetical protein